MPRALAAAAAAAAAGLAACDTNVHTLDLGPNDASPICAEAATHSDLAWIQDHIFSTNCSGSSCHKRPANEAGHLVLDPGLSYVNLVGADCEMDVARTANPPWKRVVPGDPARSYLMVLVDRYDATDNPDGFSGPSDTNSALRTMPYNSGLLCKEKRDAIRRWIADGAPDTP